MRKTNLKQNKYELVQPVFFNSKLNPEKAPIDIEKPAAQLGSNSTNGAPQIKYRTFEEDPNVTDWYYRYGRSGKGSKRNFGCIWQKDHTVYR